jgi:hypothetical protein
MHHTDIYEIEYTRAHTHTHTNAFIKEGTKWVGRQTVQYVVFLIDDCNWPEVPNRTRNDRNQSVLDKQMHLVDQSKNPCHNYIDYLVLEKLELDYNSNQDRDIVRNWNSHLVYWLNYPIENGLDHMN